MRSETWSATSLNGLITKGTKVQVIESSGVRLGVWGEKNPLDVPPFAKIDTEESGLDLPDDVAGEAPENPTTGAS